MRRTFSLLALFALLLLTLQPATACTIVSAVAKDGQVWNMNNEDGPAGIANFINVFPRTAGQTYGYYTLSYLTPGAGAGGNAQGGMNEAGLTFDFNAIDYVEDFDPASRQAYPGGNDAILAHIMGTLRSVDEVIAFFDTYWFVDGFRGAQMHVADRDGKFAIISASGVQIAPEGEPLVSTNFDLCAQEDGSSCWRYPLATAELAEREVSLATMLSIALQTRQRQYLTVYSNVQNLTTGDIWFMSYHDPNALVEINIQDLLARGQRSYIFSDLGALRGDTTAAESVVMTPTVELSARPPAAVAGTYQNNYTGDITVKPHEQGVAVTFVNGTDTFLPRPDGTYAMAEADVVLAFRPDDASGKMALWLYQDGWWTATAWRE